jgi:O-methyltransferase
MTYIRRVDGLVVVDGKSLIVGVNGTFRALDGTAQRIWDLCEYPTTPERIVDVLSAEFSVESAECLAAVTAVLNDLAAAGLVVAAQPSQDSARDAYLGLLKRAIVGLLDIENHLRLGAFVDAAFTGNANVSGDFIHNIRYIDVDGYEALVLAQHAGNTSGNRNIRFAHSFVGLQGLGHIERLAAQIFADSIEGDFVDAGTWRGGTAIYMRALQTAYAQTHRLVWVADSFTGVPKPTSAADLAAKLDLSTERYPWFYASLREVRDNFSTYGLLDSGVKFLPGLFADTLPVAPIDKIALLRLDGDLYSSTMDSLNALYDKVVCGGYIIVDDYGLAPCKQAIDEFRASRGITAPIEKISWTIVHWRKQD